MKAKLSLMLVALALIVACAPSAVTPLPAIDPGAVNTFIVQTANAASTKTAAALPSATPTRTGTPTPRFTASLTTTPTVTFVFLLPGVLSSLTAPTLANINSGTSSSKYGCNVFSTEPADGTNFAPRTDFIVTWEVKNIGRETWYRATTEYEYVSGDKLHEVSSYRISKGIETGKNISLSVDMATFKDAGTYSTKWALVGDNFYFCPMTLTIDVVD